MFLACKKHDGGIGKIGSLATKAWLQEPYAHVELILDDGMSFSASGWDNSVRFKKISYSHPQWWDFYELPKELNAYPRNFHTNQQAVALGKHVQGNKYDYIGVFFWFILKNHTKQVDSRWWCSEVCAWVLGLENFRLSPYGLKDICEKLGAEKCPPPYEVIYGRDKRIA